METELLKKKAGRPVKYEKKEDGKPNYPNYYKESVKIRETRNKPHRCDLCDREFKYASLAHHNKTAVHIKKKTIYEGLQLRDELLKNNNID